MYDTTHATEATELPPAVPAVVAPLERIVSRHLVGEEREAAKATICANHYTRSVPSGKSHYVAFGSAIVVWSIPANKNLAKSGRVTL